MSVVTDVILMAPGDPRQAVEALNADLMKRFNCSLNQVDSYAGGNKAIQASVYMGAFSYFHPDEVLALISAAPWDEDDRADIRVAIKGEWDDAFTLHPLPAQ